MPLDATLTVPYSSVGLPRLTGPPVATSLMPSRRLLRCLPHARLDERAQGSQCRQESLEERRGLLPTYETSLCISVQHRSLRRPDLGQKSAMSGHNRSSTPSPPRMLPRANLLPMPHRPVLAAPTSLLPSASPVPPAIPSRQRRADHTQAACHPSP